MAERSAPLADNLRPVRAGMPGGLYKPLNETAIAKIHASALEALEVIGLSPVGFNSIPATDPAKRTAAEAAGRLVLGEIFPLTENSHAELDYGEPATYRSADAQEGPERLWRGAGRGREWRSR